MHCESLWGTAGVVVCFGAALGCLQMALLVPASPVAASCLPVNGGRRRHSRFALRYAGSSGPGGPNHTRSHTRIGRAVATHCCGGRALHLGTNTEGTTWCMLQQCTIPQPVGRVYVRGGGGAMQPEQWTGYLHISVHGAGM